MRFFLAKTTVLIFMILLISCSPISVPGATLAPLPVLSDHLSLEEPQEELSDYQVWVDIYNSQETGVTAKADCYSPFYDETGMEIGIEPFNGITVIVDGVTLMWNGNSSTYEGSISSTPLMSGNIIDYYIITNEGLEESGTIEVPPLFRGEYTNINPNLSNISDQYTLTYTNLEWPSGVTIDLTYSGPGIGGKAVVNTTSNPYIISVLEVLDVEDLTNITSLEMDIYNNSNVTLSNFSRGESKVSVYNFSDIVQVDDDVTTSNYTLDIRVNNYDSENPGQTAVNVSCRDANLRWDSLSKISINTQLLLTSGTTIIGDLNSGDSIDYYIESPDGYSENGTTYMPAFPPGNLTFSPGKLDPVSSHYSLTYSEALWPEVLGVSLIVEYIDGFTNEIMCFNDESSNPFIIDLESTIFPRYLSDVVSVTFKYMPRKKVELSTYPRGAFYIINEGNEW